MRAMTDWAVYPGPKCYRPGDVEPALAALASASSEAAARDAYNKVLFAIGNNHRGSLYPAAVAAASRVVELALNGAGWARHAAFEVMVELCVFEAEAGFEQFTGADGALIETKEGVLRTLREAKPSLLAVLADEAEIETVRIDVLDIVEQLEEDAKDVADVLRAMPERSSQGTFDGRRRVFLVEHGYL